MNTNNRTTTWFIVAILLSTLLLDACMTRKEKTAEPIKIGSILTGEGAAWGIAAKNGIDMAVEEINADGGINGRPLKVIHEDDQSDPKKAITAFQKLTDIDKVRIIIGTSWSNTGLAVAPLADENEVLMISPSLGVKEFNEGSRFLFNTWPHDYRLSEALADHVYAQGHRKVALIGAKQVWVEDQTRAFTQRFTKLGGSIVVLVEPDPADRNPYADALKIAAQKET